MLALSISWPVARVPVTLDAVSVVPAITPVNDAPDGPTIPKSLWMICAASL